MVGRARHFALLRLRSAIAEGGFSLLTPATDDVGDSLGAPASSPAAAVHGANTFHSAEFSELVQLLLLLRTGGGAAVTGRGVTNPESDRHSCVSDWTREIQPGY